MSLVLALCVIDVFDVDVTNVVDDIVVFDVNRDVIVVVDGVVDGVVVVVAFAFMLSKWLM